MTSTDALACPFCGGKGEYDNSDTSAHEWIACTDCGARADVDVWARRATPPAPQGEREIAWTDKDGTHHSMSDESAAAELCKLFEEWPGGLDEIESSINQWRRQDGRASIATPPGWALVPIEPTEDMVHAAINDPSCPDAHDYRSIVTLYRAMLAAIASAPQTKEPT